jgi:hypothetical protein
MAVPHTFQLADGRILGAPRPRTASQLTIGARIELDGRPHRITDLQARGGVRERIIHLAGPRRILRMALTDTVGVYTVSAPPGPRPVVPPATRRPGVTVR